MQIFNFHVVSRVFIFSFKISRRFHQQSLLRDFELATLVAFLEMNVKIKTLQKMDFTVYNYQGLLWFVLIFQFNQRY